MSATDPVVVGLDLSLSSSGVARADGTVGTITFDLDGINRIDAIVDAIAITIPPLVELVAVEGYSFGSNMTYARETAELGGCVRLALWRAQVPYIDVPPGTVKKYATGDGHASKLAVIRAAEKRLGYEGESSDEADALWLRAIGWALLGVPLADLPQKNLAALAVLNKRVPVLRGGT